MTPEEELYENRIETDTEGIFNVDLDTARNIVHKYKLGLADRLEQFSLDSEYDTGQMAKLIGELRK